MQAVDNQTFAIMVMAILLMTILVKPIPHWACKTTKQFRRYKLRTLQESKPNSELRILACIHTTRNLSGIINLLELSNATEKSPICVFAACLVDLSGRTNAMVIVHDDNRNSSGQNYPVNRGRSDADQIISTLESYERRNQSMSFLPLTVVSPYTSMHEDINNLAEDKRVTLILIPFHKQSGADATQQENSSIRLVNQNLLIKSPCSVGIFIDRGLSLKIYSEGSHRREQLNFAMFFTGGHDDREALTYACRMAGSLNGLRFMTMCNPSVTWVEKSVNSGDEIIIAAKDLAGEHDLYLVGRGQGMIKPFALGLSEWGDCEELGPLGEALSTSDFAQHASILVVQQHSVSAMKSKGMQQQDQEKPGFEAWKSPLSSRDLLNIVNNRKKTDEEDD